MTALPRLYAKGYSSLDGVTPVTLWSLGNYRYEIETRKTTRATWRDNSFCVESEVFEASYEDAMKKFKDLVGDTFNLVSIR
jgi:hypothetical protein